MVMFTMYSYKIMHNNIIIILIHSGKMADKMMTSCDSVHNLPSVATLSSILKSISPSIIANDVLQV